MTVDDTLTQNLEMFGLSKNESEIYLHLLSVTESSVFDISRALKIARTTVYATLETMRRQGLVTQFRKNKVLHYSPTSPNILRTILSEKEKILQRILPSLHELSSQVIVKPKVELYTGKEGIKILLEDILHTCKKNAVHEIYAAAHPELLDAVPVFFQEWVKRRAENKVFVHLIIPSSMKHRTEYYSGHLRETRFLPANFPFQCTMDIYGNKLGFFSLKDGEIYTVIIESPTISDLFKQFFLFTWNTLERI